MYNINVIEANTVGYRNSYIYGSGDIESEVGQHGTTAGIGDINGDSIDDIVVAASKATKNNMTLAGAVYVLYGQKRSCFA